MITNPLNTISSVKTLMGKKYSEVEPYLQEFPFHIVKHGDDLLRIEVNNQLYSPEEISAMILLKLKDAADRYLSDPIESVIITVPAYFNDSQRQATKDAGSIAGLNVKRIINEPTAASLAYSIDLKKKAKIIVYDFGGGTIDISVLDVQNGIIKVLATAGNTHLGGNNFDIALTQKLTHGIRQRAPHRPFPGQGGAAAHPRGRGKRQDRAFGGRRMRDQPALHRRIRGRPRAPDQVPAPQRVREPDQEGGRIRPWRSAPGP